MASSSDVANATTAASAAAGGTCTLLLFAAASAYTDAESLTLAAPTTLGAIFRTLDARFPGFLPKILASAAVTLNLEYVDVVFPEMGEAEGESENEERWERWQRDLEGWSVAVQVGDEVGIIPPVSSG
ncbi:hypothetical protein LTR84_003253 [Exophiala bonariae]|uniref:Molybdopterin synthase sulfur carrier subunit n=1 Tax=Exophiala bonariae TaxID=1690606 RepID=A0AAV9N9H4_9EURO|nr:hypothetical protein LTR84_003253 [Exophiala bonariae]